eukprot:scaffold9692_cov96-Isochrysis_galbana.AAC.6
MVELDCRARDAPAESIAVLLQAGAPPEGAAPRLRPAGQRKPEGSTTGGASAVQAPCAAGVAERRPGVRNLQAPHAAQATWQSFLRRIEKCRWRAAACRRPQDALERLAPARPDSTIAPRSRPLPCQPILGTVGAFTLVLPVSLHIGSQGCPPPLSPLASGGCAFFRVFGGNKYYRMDKGPLSVRGGRRGGASGPCGARWPTGSRSGGWSAPPPYLAEDVPRIFRGDKYY